MQQMSAARTLAWQAGLGIGALVLVAAAVVAALGPGRNLITHAADHGQGQTQGDRGDRGARGEHHAAAGQPMVDCTLILPANPLTAQGLATPFQLAASDGGQGACHEANPDEMAFAQAAALDPATGAISIYDPLVVDKGHAPAAAPVVPKLPVNAVVALWFGFNGNILRLAGPQQAGGQAATLTSANCVNALGDSVFGQVSSCNALQFFALANTLIQAHHLTPPALGMAKDGKPCPTVRDFSVVDQDQSDNVTTAYLVTPRGGMAQDTPANAAALPTAVIARNGSDNGLLVKLDGALGCTPWMAPDLVNPGQMTTGLPLNELQAAAAQQQPVALTPIRDPMVLRGTMLSLDKLNLYRQGVDQPLATSLLQAQQDQLTYCQNLFAIAPVRLKLDAPLTSGVSSPDPMTAADLFTFLAARFNFSVGPNGLDCTELLHVKSPIRLTTDAAGIVTNATILLPPAAPVATPTTTTSTTTTTTSGTPSCVVNGMPIAGCAGTTTINGQTCAFSFDAATRQVIVTCPAA